MNLTFLACPGRANREASAVPAKAPGTSGAPVQDTVLGSVPTGNPTGRLPRRTSRSRLASLPWPDTKRVPLPRPRARQRW